MKKLIGLVAAMFVAVSLFGQGTAMRRDANLSDVMNNSASGDQIMRHFIGMSNCVPAGAVYGVSCDGQSGGYNLHVIQGHQYFMFNNPGGTGIGQGAILMYAIDWQTQCSGDNKYVPFPNGEWSPFTAGTNIVQLLNPGATAGNVVDQSVFDITESVTLSNFFGKFYGTFRGNGDGLTFTTSGGFVPIQNGFSTNQIIQAATIINTNQPTGATLISGTIGTYVFTTTANGFANFHPGDQISVAPGTLNEQYTVIAKYNNTTIRTFEPLTRTYTSTNYLYYPLSTRLADINNHDSGAIESDGSIALSDFGFGLTFIHNSGSDSVTNGWRIANYFHGAGGDLQIQDSRDGLAPQPSTVYIHQQDAANPRPLEIMPNGYVGFTQGITNAGGVTTIQVGANLAPQSGFQYIGNGAGLTNMSYHIQTNFISGKLYTNGYGHDIRVSANASLVYNNTIPGVAEMALESPTDIVTNYGRILDVIGTGDMDAYAYVSLVISNNGTYIFTNRSTGGSNGATIVTGTGQIQVIP